MSNLRRRGKIQKIFFQYGALTAPLLDAINLLSLETWEDDRLVLRLEHIFQKNEDAGQVTVDITVSNFITFFCNV